MIDQAPLNTDQIETRAKRVLELDGAVGLIDQTRVLHGALVLLLCDLPQDVRREICRPLSRSFKHLAE